MKLKEKNIIVGITGSIAAFKSATIVRLLKKEGANIKVIMTPLAKEFITPVTLATLSQNTVLSEFFKYDDGKWNNHVELGLWADLFIIAPATANTIAKMAYGIADNLLLTTYLSVRCPVMVVPAMDTNMYQHPATVQNIEILKQRGHIVIEPIEGELASGLIGKGRMVEPEIVVENIINFFSNKSKLSNKNILITAGPTYEHIDPVRVIGNLSTGKTGYLLAEYFANFGANVTLISGPTSFKCYNNKINCKKVTSASEMYNACKEHFNNADIVVFSAAVADYTPQKTSSTKIKKTKKALKLNLIPTIDIAKELGKVKNKNQILVGFALETNNFESNALKKLKEKNLDLIILNKISDLNNPLQSEYNEVTIYNKNGDKYFIPLSSKEKIAFKIVEYLINSFNL
ncbi:MAG: bifunctional phosphopantothenoylcysteine decarboxylase/phosphopantothenate--cysteine ligase CoaBC [Bacteroidales bacterium]|nr:bifunctional phosphopantothenoylcysteine decarboxylase/phosphopantothenate--cysteine ligase CoaBC [Bacteroidales bacterium]